VVGLGGVRLKGGRTKNGSCEVFGMNFTQNVFFKYTPLKAKRTDRSSRNDPVLLHSMIFDRCVHCALLLADGNVNDRNALLCMPIIGIFSSFSVRSTSHSKSVQSLIALSPSSSPSSVAPPKGARSKPATPGQPAAEPEHLWPAQ